MPTPSLSTAEQPAPAGGAPAVDGVRLAVLTNRMEGIVRKMTNTLFRTARSGVINTARDFSCCILSHDDELLVAAESIPIHVLSGPDLVVKKVREYHPLLKRGDAFLHNNPYEGNSHAADHCIVVPIIDEAGAHRFTVFVKAHQADCGGSRPTTYDAEAKDVYDEGPLIFSAARIQTDYVTNEDIVRMCKLRIRVPEMWHGDFLAMMGAARIGEAEMLSLAEEVGWDELDSYAAEWLDYSEQRMISAIRRMPSGSATVTSTHDAFPDVCDQIPVKTTVTVDSEAAIIEVDYRDNPDCLPCGLNMTEATARIAAMIGVFNSVGATVSPNAGSFRRLRIHLRENCAVGIPRHPASCSVATSNLPTRAACAVQLAISELGEGQGMAEGGALMSGSFVVSGQDPRRGGSRFVNLICLGPPSGPAGPYGDGWVGADTLTNGLMYRDSIEADEFMYPLVIWAHRLEPGTAGDGKNVGGSSIFLDWGAAEGATVTGVWSADGTQYGAQGARDGRAGAACRLYTLDGDGTMNDRDACGQLTLEAGQRLLAYSCAGGGYGDPRDRDRELVRRDLDEGLITAETAREVYGLALPA